MNLNRFNLNLIYPYLFTGILILALILRLQGLDKGIWVDEAFTIQMIAKENLGKMLQALKKDVHPPLYYLLLYFWAKISNSEPYLRLFSVGFGLGIVAVAMLWLRSYSRLASILSGFYLATAPIMLRFSQEIRGYSLLLFTTTLAFFFASRIIAKPEQVSGYLGLAISLSIAISTKLIGIMLLPPLFLFLVLMTTLEKKTNQWGKILSAFILPILLFIFFNFFYLTQLSQNTDNYWIPNISSYLVLTTLQYLFGLNTLFFSSYLNHILAFLFLALLFIAFIWGKWQTNFIFLLVSIFFGLEIIIYSLIKTPIFWYRNILPSFIPFTAFLGLQIATIQVKKIKITSIILLTIFSILVTANWITLQAYQPVEYSKKVSELIESKWQPNNLVLFYPGYLANAVKYYFDTINPEIVIGIYNEINIQKIKDKTNTDVVFLIARVDLSGSIKNFRNILLALKSEFKQPTKFKVFLIISHDYSFVKDKDEYQNFLAILATEFGQPLFYQDQKVYVFSEYEI